MAFNSREFPGRKFSTIDEYQEACLQKKSKPESNLDFEEMTQVTAVVMPAPKRLLEEKISNLERKVDRVGLALQKALSRSADKEDPLEVGTILEGESKGNKFTLEVIKDGFLCSNGDMYQSLSGAAQGVSGNRRSGWKFWKDSSGKPIGQVLGRFKESDTHNPFDT